MVAEARGTGRGLHVLRLFDGAEWRDSMRLEVDREGRVRSLERNRAAPGDSRFEVLIPALVDAHAHSELDPLEEEYRDRSFLDWIDGVRASRAADRRPAGLRTKDHVRRLLETGTLWVSDIDSEGAAGEALLAAGIGGRVQCELLGFDLGPEEVQEALRRGAERLPAALRGKEGRTSLPWGGTLAAGFAPHAPYSVSEALFRAAAVVGGPLTVHVGETEDELRLLEEGEGPFRRLLERLGRWPDRYRPPGRSPLACLESWGLLSPRTQVVHLHANRPGDLDILRRSGAAPVLCPGTIRYFGRELPPLKAWLEAGLAVGLGTDSLASNEDLDMLAETAILSDLAPWLEPREILRLATSGGGRCLAIPSAGRIRLGLPLAALALEGAPRLDPPLLEEWIVSGRPVRRGILRGLHWDPVRPVL